MSHVTSYQPTDQHAAHRDVTAQAAQATPVEWPVSGDQSVRQYGLDGRRTTVDLWMAPGVEAPEAQPKGYALYALAGQWGRDAAEAGLPRTTLEDDREAVRAIRDAAHTEGFEGAYQASAALINRAWLIGFDSI